MGDLQTAKTKYGPRKIGDSAFAKQQAEATLSKRGATKYGPRKGGGVRAGDPDNVNDEAGYDEDANTNPFLTEDGKLVSIGDAKDVLDAEPELLDLAIETEAASGSPRKGAVEHYLKLESERDSGPRDGVVSILERLIEE